jgi:hypothetical protein
MIYKLIRGLWPKRRSPKQIKKMEEVNVTASESVKKEVTEIAKVEPEIKQAPKPKPKEYQWIRGERAGILEIYKENKVKAGKDWIYFESGKRIDSSLLSEFMLEINERQAPLDLGDIRKVPVAGAKPSTAMTESSKSPIRILLEKQKKFDTVKVIHEMEINLPAASLYEVMLDNFGEEVKTELIEMLLGKLNTEEIREQLKKTIVDTIDKYYKNEEV